ncbi:hypothetical protein RB791 [Rhodopirellula baltica SH 1]|uniref:Uncharacterized protein n=1 Tax=Rhodopirellula baltica (strain DSM 10527 / NCIMB 13988 / SH1) TaxID=243090 RepID=Q7UY94_RHOBA|nr:hypothetical protein RB791 [Rhodopirellula baltica SH 1]
MGIVSSMSRLGCSRAGASSDRGANAGPIVIVAYLPHGGSLVCRRSDHRASVSGGLPQSIIPSSTKL